MYKIGHEEQGHFVLALDDTSYIEWLRSQEVYREVILPQAIAGAVQAGATGSKYLKAQDYIPLYFQLGYAERQTRIERAADEVGEYFYRAYRSN